MSSSVVGVAPRRSPSTQTSASAERLATSISPSCAVSSICQACGRCRPRPRARGSTSRSPASSASVDASGPGAAAVFSGVRPRNSPSMLTLASAGVLAISTRPSACASRTSGQLQPADPRAHENLVAPRVVAGSGEPRARARPPSSSHLERRDARRYAVDEHRCSGRIVASVTGAQSGVRVATSDWRSTPPRTSSSSVCER